MSGKMALVLVLAALPLPVRGAEEPVDWATIGRIRDEGFNNPKVMETASYLTDVIGPRVTGSTQAKRAHDWTREQLESWGLMNAHLESYPFGPGWSLLRTSVHMIAPDQLPLLALPKGWSPGTDGPVRGAVVRLKLESEDDLEKAKGTLAGKIVFVSDPRELTAPDKPLFDRYDEKEMAEIYQFPIPGARRAGGPDGPPRRFPRDREAMIKRFKFQNRLRAFLGEEKVLATVEISDRDGGNIRVGGEAPRGKEPSLLVPSLVMAAEQYNRICRLLEGNIPVELELDVKVSLNTDDKAYNTIAEIPGTDKKGEYVLLGAHMDSWHAGTGATDDAAGVSVVMEAVRILGAIGIKPKRTIRVGLWSGEEEGFLGSRAYVSEHLAARAESPDSSEQDLPFFMRRNQGPLTINPEHAKLSAYFNLDNGTGRIRGIYAQQNTALIPIFEAWLKPLADLGATVVVARNTGGTDHQPFDSVGIPGFQFIQDEADYMTRTHHSNADVYDRLQREDLMQASVVMATFAYQAAMRDQMLPRKPMPKDPPKAGDKPAANVPVATPPPR